MIYRLIELTPLSHMEVGYPGTWGEGSGAGTAEPKPKQPEHPRAHPTCNPATSPARQQKKKKPCPNPCPSTRHTELEEKWRTYIKDYIKYNIKGWIGVGSIEKASYIKTPCTLSKVKLRTCANGTCIAP